jgi:hypothetical protein
MVQVVGFFEHYATKDGNELRSCLPNQSSQQHLADASPLKTAVEKCLGTESHSCTGRYQTISQKLLNLITMKRDRRVTRSWIHQIIASDETDLLCHNDTVFGQKISESLGSIPQLQETILRRFNLIALPPSTKRNQRGDILDARRATYD